MTPKRLQELKEKNADAAAVIRVTDLYYPKHAVDELIAEVERLQAENERHKEGLFQMQNAAIDLALQSDRLRKQNEKLREQRNIYHTICDENDLVNYHRHIKALDAEIEAIK